MDNALVVTTECPTCGGPLDFSEGSNATRCPFCRSNLLVTGRKQSLSYYIEPKLVIQRAVARVMIAHKAAGRPCRVVNPELFFLPYYRLTGHDLRFEEKEPGKEPLHPAQDPAYPAMPAWSPTYRPESDLLFSAIRLAGNLIGRVFSDPSAGHSNPPPLVPPVNPEPRRFHAGMSSGSNPVSESTRGEVRFIDRYVEKNFIACGIHGSGIYSLGVRPSVLRLRLFDREGLQSQGKVVSPTVAPAEAFATAMKTAGSQRLLYRRVLGQVLSIIYFPYWIVEAERGGKSFLTLVDAVSESVVDLDSPCRLREDLKEETGSTDAVAGFRPLVCPNCGWDFSVRPADIIFFCASCKKVWQIHGEELSELPYQIASEPPGLDPKTLRHLPFWVVDARVQNDPPSRYYVPAFRYSRLKALKDLARAVTAKQPPFASPAEPSLDLEGCFYDQEDAVKFAEMIYIDAESDPFGRIQNLDRSPLEVSGLTLVWFPFEERGSAVFHPETGFSLSRNLFR